MADRSALQEMQDAAARLAELRLRHTAELRSLLEESPADGDHTAAAKLVPLQLWRNDPNKREWMCLLASGDELVYTDAVEKRTKDILKQFDSERGRKAERALDVLKASSKQRVDGISTFHEQAVVAEAFGEHSVVSQEVFGGSVPGAPVQGVRGVQRGVDMSDSEVRALRDMYEFVNFYVGGVPFPFIHGALAIVKTAEDVNNMCKVESGVMRDNKRTQIPAQEGRRIVTSDPEPSWFKFEFGLDFSAEELGITDVNYVQKRPVRRHDVLVRVLRRHEQDGAVGYADVPVGVGADGLESYECNLADNDVLYFMPGLKIEYSQESGRHA